mgnify:FL=1
MKDIQRVTVDVIHTDMSCTNIEKYGVCGKVVEKEVIVGKSEKMYCNVIFRFKYNGYNEDALTHINLFAYALGYSGNIDEDINCIEEDSFAYEYPETIYTLLFKSKDEEDSIIISSDPSHNTIKVDIISEKLRENPDAFDDAVIGAYAMHCR